MKSQSGTPQKEKPNSTVPFCVSRGETADTKKRFRFNKEKLVGVCYNCGWGGNAVTFVRDLNNLTWADALDIVNFYSEFKPLPADVFEEVFDRIYIEGKDTEVDRNYIPLPSDFKLLSNSNSLIAEPIRKYAKSRNLTEKQIEIHGMGFCPTGEIILPNNKSTFIDNRLITQVFDDNGKPVYWMGRSILKDAKPKTFNPVGGRNTINKTDVIFNLNNAKKTGFAVISEGVFDATTIGNSGTALFGKTLSVKQLLLLIRADLEAVYVMLDPDAKKNALVIADLLSKHLNKVFLCDLRGGDPNEVGKRACFEALKTAEKYDQFTALKYRLLE